MDEQKKHRSGRKFEDDNVIDVEDNLSHYDDEELSETEVQEEEYTPEPPKRRNNSLVAGVVLASLAVVGGGYYYLEHVKPQQAQSSTSQASTSQSTTTQASSSTPVASSSAASSSAASSTTPESTSGAGESSSASTSQAVNSESSAESSTATSSQAGTETSSESATPPEASTTVASESTAETTSSGVDVTVNNPPKTTLDAVNSGTSDLVNGMVQSADNIAGHVVGGIDAAVGSESSEAASTEGAAATSSETSASESAGASSSTNTSDTASTDTASTDASTQATPDTNSESAASSVASETTSPSEATSTAESTSQETSLPSSIPSTEVLVNNEVQSALSKASAEMNQLQSQLQNQAQEIEQLKGQLQEALHLNRQVSNQIGSAPSLQSLSQPLVMAEVIHLYNSASYEVQIAGNVEKAKRILNMAHNSVSSTKDAAFNNLANAIAADINVLNNSKGVNVELLFQGTSQLQTLLDQVRFVSPDLQPQAATMTEVASTSSTDTSSTQESAESSWFDRAYDTTSQWAGQAYDALASDIGGLIKVEKLSNPDLGIIPVDQVQMVRNNLKQDVRIAQDAMLKQDDGLWKSSLQNVLDNVQKYYDPSDERMESLLTLIKQLQDLSVKPELPELKFTKEAIEQTSRELETSAPVKY